mgnify:CR=1 FL=1
MEKYKVGVIGATGMVGQRFVTLLEGHPWFQLTVVAASPRSAARWALITSMCSGFTSGITMGTSAVQRWAELLDTTGHSSATSPPWSR